MSKPFPIIGTAIKNGKTLVRGAFEFEARIKAMTKDGQTNIVLVELPVPMNNLHGCNFIRTLPEFQTPEQQEAINAYITNNDDGTEIVFEEVEAPADDAGLTDEQAAALEAALTSDDAAEPADVTDTGGIDFPELEAHDASEYFDSLNDFEEQTEVE